MYDPTPGDMIRISEADMFIYTGAEMEPWAQELADSVDMSKVKVVDASSGVSMMKEEDEEHEHAEAEEDSVHAEEDSHDHSSHHHEHTYDQTGDQKTSHHPHTHNNGQCCQQRNQKLIKPDSDTAGLCEILIECDQEQPIIKYDKQHKNDNRQHNAEDHILSAHSQNTAEHITVDIYIESTAHGSDDHTNG